jgi:nitrile hydratase accessory protein
VTTAPLLDVTGPAAPPRRNGELAFGAPWESRVFGVTVALHEAGRFAWDDFRRRLIVEIARTEGTAGWSYWTCWLRALEALLEAEHLCASSEIEARERVLAARAPGHDHPAR